MQDNVIFFGSLSACCLLGQVDIGLPKWTQDVGSMAIVAFVVWFTLTRMESAIAKLNESIQTLSENIQGLKGDHSSIKTELYKIEYELEREKE